MKQLARRSVYWFGLNKDIESHVKACRTCNEIYIAQKPKTSNEWIPTTRPFSRLHADFFYFQQKVFLIIVDSNSKWLELELMPHGISKKVIRKFTALFARFGFPDVVVTDGGPPFNSTPFIKFLENQGIKVLKSPPYNPQSNGQAERMVRLIKEVFKKYLLDPQLQSLGTEERIYNFLFNYRNTCLDNGDFPSERVFCFKPKTDLDLINPKLHYKKQLTIPKHDKTNSQKRTVIPAHDPLIKLTAGDPVYYKNYNPTDIRRWVRVKFIKNLSTNIFQISFGGRLLSAHRQQLRLVENCSDRNFVPVLFDRDAPDRKHDPDPASTTNAEQIESEEEDFYGFAAESCIYRAPVQSSTLPLSLNDASLSRKRKNVDTPVWRSKRLKHSKKNSDYVYY